MKKLFSFALVALLTGLLLCSCTKTKEEQLIDDMKAFVEKMEAMTPDQFKADEGKTAMEFVEKIKTEYGLDLNQGFSAENCKAAGLNINEEQAAELMGIQAKMLSVVAKLMGAEISGTVEEAPEAPGDSVTEPAPVEEAPAE